MLALKKMVNSYLTNASPIEKLFYKRGSIVAHVLAVTKCSTEATLKRQLSIYSNIMLKCLSLAASSRVSFPSSPMGLPLSLQVERERKTPP